MGDLGADGLQPIRKRKEVSNGRSDLEKKERTSTLLYEVPAWTTGVSVLALAIPPNQVI